MRLLVLLLLTGCLGTLQYAWLSHRPGAPDLLLALLVWVVLASGPITGLVRAWAIGLMRDAIDPAAHGFHFVLALLLAMGLQLLGSIVDRRHAFGRFAAGVGVVLVMALIEGLVVGLAAVPWGAMLASALWTGLAVLVLEWLLGGLPRALSPVAAREAAW